MRWSFPVPTSLPSVLVVSAFVLAGPGWATTSVAERTDRGRWDGTNLAAAQADAADEAVQAAADATVPPRRSLYLAVGHGRTPEGRFDPGSIDPRTGAVETEAAQTIVDAMAEVLRTAPDLQLWAESGDHPNMRGSVARANRKGADDCIEVHQEWAGAPQGAFAHWYSAAGQAQRLADRLVESIRLEGVPTRDSWHRARPELFFLRETTCRAVLVEVGRVGDHPPDTLRAIGRAMAESYLEDIAN